MTEEKSLKEQLESLKSDNPEVRSSAIDSFENTALNSEAAEALCSLVSDPDKGVRNSLSILFSNNDNELIPQYLVSFIPAKDLSVRNFAGELLLKIGSPAVKALLDSIDKGDHDDKKFIIDILGLIGDRIASSKILDVLNSSDEDNVILACIEALGNLSAENSIRQIINFYPKNELYRATIIEALGKICLLADQSEVAEAREFVQSKYDGDDELTKFSIVECLGNIGDESTFTFLLKKLEESQGPLQWSIIKSISLLKEKYDLLVIPNQYVINAILYTITEAECFYKQAAVHILPSIDTKEVMRQCLSLYSSCTEIDDLLKPKFFDRTELLYEASSELIALGEIDVKPILLLINEAWDMPGNEKEKFNLSVHRKALIDSLITCLDDPDEEVRMITIEMLFSIDKTNTVYFIENFVEDPNVWNRLKVIDMLENVSLPKAEEILKKLADDEEEMVSEKAKNCLAKRVL
jgi:HEAT repeat protein